MSEFDELLDRVLGEVAEPREGLEARVLARVRAAGRERRGWGLAGWAGGAAACGLLAALAVWPLWRHAPGARGEPQIADRAEAGGERVRVSGVERVREEGKARRSGYRRVRTSSRTHTGDVPGGAGADGGRGEGVSEALVWRYVAEAGEPLARPEDLVIRPLEFAVVAVAPLGGTGLGMNKDGRSDR